ncbi:MAK32 [[Candida] subhashii]|uniref:MAK32 n=1 Tax=[Candida] subhashii TaxID=561895 RepID=A0A8J5UYD4_9ASCO|nr:MAK32 [[Candida] subhashii]KAG7664220.1 MAK32 [[Candida] subhashii]
MSQTILTTLGMMIIDEIQYPPSSNKPPITDQIGGAGPYAIIGARVISTINHASQISGIIDKGAEFPKEVESEIQNWGTGVIFREDKSRLTTRGVNVYSEDDIRSFYYQTPKKRIVVDDVLEFPKLAESRAYHLICSISRCEEIIDRLNEIFDKDEEKKMFIFEPLPDDCKHKNLEALKRLLPKINIFTPNLDEARDLLNSSSEEDVKEIATRFSEFLQLPNSGTVIRCGPQGCHISTKGGNSFGLPAYHQDPANVIDVTGGRIYDGILFK